MAELTPENCRAAMGLLGWSWVETANTAGISEASLARFMRGETVQQGTRDKIVAAFTGAGVKLYNSDRPGARLYKSVG